jgi:positive phototaxis protein PixI
MVHLQTPDLGVLELEVPDQEQTDLYHAKQGNAQAITALFNRKLSDRRMTVQSDRKAERLGILIEADTLPDRQSMGDWMRQQIIQLNPDGVRKVEIYGRQTGQRVPAWREIFDLNPDSVEEIDPFRLADWLRQGSSETSPAQVSHEAPGEAIKKAAQDNTLTQFLRFHLSATETALLPLDSIKEILQVPTAGILAVPQMPNSVLGVCNTRGNILWLIDLGLHLGVSRAVGVRSLVSNSKPSPLRSPISTGVFNSAVQSLTTILIEVEQKILGLVVPQVLDIETHSLEHLQPPVKELFPPGLLPFITGYLARSSSPVLSLLPLLNDPNLQTHRQSINTYS